MYTPASIRSVRLLLIVAFLLATFYFISRSYNQLPIPSLSHPDGFPPLAKEPTKPAHVHPAIVEDPALHDGDIKTPQADPGKQLETDKKVQKGKEIPVGKKLQTGKMKATFVSLIRNNELWEIVKSIRQVEDRFNRHYHYPWVFLNDVPFTEEFIKVTSDVVSGETYYVLVPTEHWSIPGWIDEEKARKAREDMEHRNIIYGGSLPYRHMCRFQSGFFFQQPALDPYDWYWRVEPGTNYYCDIDYDVFEYMELNDFKYGFTLSLHEYHETIPTLWDETKKFIKEHPEYVAKDNALDFISENNGETYNNCHFWSNFEVASLKLWRNETYLKYFEFLDKAGGFFYERWGDAPVHSIAASLFLHKKQIHFFNDIGYYHVPFYHCPNEEEFRTKCYCNPADNFDWKGFSCTRRWFDVNNMEKPKGWEKLAD